MGGLFSIDNPIMRFLNKATDCVILNLIWLLGCMPIVTIGASTTAFYYTVTKVIRNDRGYVMQAFWHSFKSNFKQSTIVWIVMMIAGLFCYFDLYYTYALIQVDAMPQIFFWFLIGIFLVAFMWMFYWFPYIARFENTFKQMRRLTLIMAIQNLLWTVLMGIIFVVMILAVLFIPLLIIIVPAVGTILISVIMERVFRKYMSEEDLRMEDIRNGKIVEDEEGV